MAIGQGHVLEKADVHRLLLECNEAQDCGEGIHDLILEIAIDGLDDLCLSEPKWFCDSVVALPGPVQSLC